VLFVDDVVGWFDVPLIVDDVELFNVPFSDNDVEL